MTRHPLTTLAALASAISLLGCGAENANLNILDAASIYESNRASFRDIRTNYPGPFAEFTRIPARDPSKSTRQGKALLEALRKDFPVEFIDFFPQSNTGKNEINVILTRYGANAEWTIISLVYSNVPLPPPDSDRNMALFDRCDQRALDWFEKDHGEGSVSAFCQVDAYWYAFQQVG